MKLLLHFIPLLSGKGLMMMLPHALKYHSHLYFLESVLGPKILDRKTTGFSLSSNRTKPSFLLTQLPPSLKARHDLGDPCVTSALAVFLLHDLE